MTDSLSPNIDKKEFFKEMFDKCQKGNSNHYINVIKYNGFRWILPYYFIFKTFVKSRWLGKTLFEIYVKEFGHKPEQIENYFKLGRIRVNNEIMSLSTVLTDNMTIETLVHRHEFPVPDVNIDILFNSDDLIVVDKPSGMPVHPSGRFNHNSLSEILKRDYQASLIYSVHRLDRYTSGVLVFAKSSKIADDISKILRLREAKKIYLCKVKGYFPDEITCNKPLRQVSCKFAVCTVDDKGKPSTTMFKRLSYDKDFSYIACFPKTGRMHQIRVHLQYLGFPIIGDYLYNPPLSQGQKRTAQSLITDNEHMPSELLKGDSETFSAYDLESIFLDHDQIEFPPQFKVDFVEDCDDCISLIHYCPSETLHLHSYYYKFGKYSFKTNFPSWFKSDMNEIDPVTIFEHS